MGPVIRVSLPFAAANWGGCAVMQSCSDAILLVCFVSLLVPLTHRLSLFSLT
jgi:hypothetical protein